jgi:RNA polymerase sigma-70 factor (ECF subfamily)
VRPVEVAVVQEVAEPADLGDHAQRVVDSMIALEILDRLSEEHRAVVVELYFHGRSGAEAAEVLGIPVGTVKSRAHRALSSMRDLMGGMAALREMTAG